MIGFNQKNTIDIDSNNKQKIGFNKISHPFEYYYKRGNLPIDLWNFQQRCDDLEAQGILKPANYEKKELYRPEDLKLPEIMPYRNHTPPYQKERYKQNMKMKSLDAIIKYKQEHEKVSTFQMRAYEKPIRYYKEYFNGDSRLGKQLQQQSYKSQYDFPTSQGQFNSNIPNYYASRESSSPLKNIQQQNLHQYKVIASENENNINYKIYNNDYPKYVDSIKQQYENQKEQFSNEPSFFQKHKTLDYKFHPLAAQQYDPPKKQIEEEPEFRLMMPIMPVYVPMNDNLPDDYMVVLPQIPQQNMNIVYQNNFVDQTNTNTRSVTSKYRDADKLSQGKFANGQQQNRFVEPQAKRYLPESRFESLNKKYKPDLLPRGDKAGYNLNPHSTAVNVVYQRQINNHIKEIEDVEAQKQKEIQDIENKKRQEEEYARNVAKIFKN